MANVLTVVWFVIIATVAQTGLLVWAALMLPNPVRRARARIERKPGTHFFLGLVFWGLTLAVAGNLIGHGKQGGAQLLGWLMIGPSLAGLTIGYSAVASIMADRLRGMMTDAGLPRLVGGAFLTAVAPIVPLVGWFVFLPVVGLMSLGAGVLGIFSQRDLAEPVQQAVPHIPVAPVASYPEQWTA